MDSSFKGRYTKAAPRAPRTPQVAARSPANARGVSKPSKFGSKEGPLRPPRQQQQQQSNRASSSRSDEDSHEPPSWLKEITKDAVKGINPERLRMMQEDEPEEVNNSNNNNEQASFIASHFAGSGPNTSSLTNSRIPRTADGKKDASGGTTLVDQVKAEREARVAERKKLKEKVNAMFQSAMATKHKIEAELRLARKEAGKNKTMIPFVVKNGENSTAGEKEQTIETIFPINDKMRSIVHSIADTNSTRARKTSSFARKAAVGALYGAKNENTFELNVEINDTKNRSLISSNAFRTQLANSIPGYCYISVAGKYYPDKSLSVEEGEAPLYLHVHCKEKSVLDEVAKNINEAIMEDSEKLREQIEAKRAEYKAKEEREKFIAKQKALENNKWLVRSKLRKDKYKKYQAMSPEERADSIKKKYDEEEAKGLKIEVPLTKNQMDYDKHFNFKRKFYGFKGENIDFILKKYKLTDSEVKVRLKGAGFNIDKVTLKKDLSFPPHALIFDRTDSIDSEILSKINKDVEDLVTFLVKEFVEGRRAFEANKKSVDSKKKSKKAAAAAKKAEAEKKSSAVKEEEEEEEEEVEEDDDDVVIDELFVPDAFEESTESRAVKAEVE